ncbi:MAG: ribosome recycling factor [Nitrospiria bacterium]
MGEVKRRGGERMEAAIERLRKDLAAIRTGRASLSLVDGIQVDYFGTPTPLKQVASLSVPESRLITIQPWEAARIPEIEKAIQLANIGVQPSNDGKVIRLSIPPLTQERRKEYVKLAKKMGEEAKVAVRTVRRDVNEELKKAHKDGELSEDQQRTAQDDIQRLTDQYVARVEEILVKKEAEILEV